MPRRDVQFPSADGSCAGWMFDPPDADDTIPLPTVVLGHGLGGVKEMRLDAFAERFTAAGYRCLIFDYRHFGASSGDPRQLLDIKRELTDWRSAVAYARGLPSVDADRVVLWGSSFGGGLVIDVAAADPRIAAVISQCPFTDGFASMRASNVRSLSKVVARAIRDVAAAATRRPPVMVDLAGPPGSTALMTAPDCEPGYLAVAADAPAFRNEVAARFALAITRYFPGRRVRKLNCPILFGICLDDSVAPAAATQRHARRSARSEVSEFPCGHFDVYLGEPFERAVDDYVDFLRRHVPVDA